MQLDGRLGLDFQTDGFVVVRDVFSRDEVRDLRDAIDREAASAKALGHGVEVLIRGVGKVARAAGLARS